MDNLDAAYRACAERCFYEHIACDGEPGGAIHRWVMRNIKFRPGTEFFIVLGIACELAKLERATEEPNPRFCRGQRRLFEPYNRLRSCGTAIVPDPRFGKLTD